MDTDEVPRRRWAKGVSRLSLGVLVLCVVAVAGMYVRGGRTSLGVVLAGGLPVTIAVAVLAAVVGWWHRRWLRVVLVLALLGSQAPLLAHLVADETPVADDASRIRVATLNTNRAGSEDEDLVALARKADVLALQEWEADRTEDLTSALGPEWRPAAQDHDDYIDAEVAVWVRRPWRVDALDPLPGRQPGNAVHLSREDDRITVVGTRLQNPAFGAADRWGDGLDSLRRATEETDGAVVVLGDLNAPPSAVAFRRFTRAADLRSCTDQLGLGFPGTWGRSAGADFAPVPIDHALTRDATCTDLEITRDPGSDHRALTATVALD